MRKITAILLTVVLLCSALMLGGCGKKEEPAPAPAAPALTEAEVQQKDTYTVHACVPRDWDTVYIWAWSDTQGDAFDAWPGEAMQVESDLWYSYEVPNGYTNLIISGMGGDVQTIDLAVEAKEQWLVVAGNLLVQHSYTRILDAKRADKTTALPEEKTSYDSSAYDSVFEAMGISDARVVDPSLHALSVLGASETVVMKMEYGYNDDGTQELAIVYYYHMSASATDDQVSEGIKTMRDNMQAGLTGLDFVDFSDELQGEVLIMTIHARNLSEGDNAERLVEAMGLDAEMLESGKLRMPTVSEAEEMGPVKLS